MRVRASSSAKKRAKRRRSRGKAAVARLMAALGLVPRLVPAEIAALYVGRGERDFLRLVKLKRRPKHVTLLEPDSKAKLYDLREIDRLLDAARPHIHTDPKAVREGIRAERLAAKARQAAGQQEDRS